MSLFSLQIRQRHLTIELIEKLEQSALISSYITLPTALFPYPAVRITRKITFRYTCLPLISFLFFSFFLNLHFSLELPSSYRLTWLVIANPRSNRKALRREVFFFHHEVNTVHEDPSLFLSAGNKVRRVSY